MKEEKRKEYAYILCIGGKIKEPISVHWWSTERKMKETTADMWAAARLFKKTASVLAYEREQGYAHRWKYVFSHQHCNWCTPTRIMILDDGRILTENEFI